jgi:hypothetical protein
MPPTHSHKKKYQQALIGGKPKENGKEMPAKSNKKNPPAIHTAEKQMTPNKNQFAAFAAENNEEEEEGPPKPKNLLGDL